MLICLHNSGGRHSSRTDGCKPCESACKVSALSSHWTCIAIWFTFCAENLHRYQSMWKIYLSFICMNKCSGECNTIICKQYVFTYLSECNQLVVQLIPVEAMVHWSVIALVVWNSNYFFLNFCMGNTEVRRGSGVTVFVDRACIILARDIFELSPTPDTYVGF